MRAAGGEEEVDGNDLAMRAVAAAQDDDQLSFEVLHSFIDIIFSTMSRKNILQAKIFLYSTCWFSLLIFFNFHITFCKRIWDVFDDKKKSCK